MSIVRIFNETQSIKIYDLNHKVNNLLIYGVMHAQRSRWVSMAVCDEYTNPKPAIK